MELLPLAPGSPTSDLAWSPSPSRQRSAASDLAWSPSPSRQRQRLPSLSPGPSRAGTRGNARTPGARDAALERELGAPDGLGGRVGERVSSSESPKKRSKRKKRRRRKRPEAPQDAPRAHDAVHREQPEPQEDPTMDSQWPAPASPIKPAGERVFRSYDGDGTSPGKPDDEAVLNEQGIRVRSKGFGGRRRIDKKHRRSTKGKHYARLDEYAQQQEAEAEVMVPVVKEKRPDTAPDVAPEASDGSQDEEYVVDDGIQGTPSVANPLYLQITVADGVLARTGAADARMAVYPIPKGAIIRCTKRVVRADVFGNYVRWYRVNSPLSSTHAALSDCGGNDSPWVRACRKHASEEQPVFREVERPLYQERCRMENALFEAIAADAALALVEADVKGCAAFVARAARRLEERRVMIKSFAPLCRELATSLEARTKATEAVLDLDGDEKQALEATRAAMKKGREAAVHDARRGDLQYKPDILLKQLARHACQTHDAREALWTLLLSVAAKVNLFILQNDKTRVEARKSSLQSPLRDDLFVGLAMRGDGAKVRDLLERGYVSCDVRHSSADVSALFAAVTSGVVEAVGALLDFGADPDCRDPHDLVLPLPLHVAASNGFYRITKLLLERGAGRSSKNNENETAYALAQKQSLAKGDAWDQCCGFLRLEPSPVEGVYVAKTDDQTVCIEWPVPRSHKSEDADNLVEAFRATASIDMGAERQLTRSRTDCLRRGGLYQMTFNDLPSLACLEIVVEGRTNGLYGPASHKVVAFTEGRRPLACGIAHPAGVDFDMLRVEFPAVEATEDSVEPRAPPLEFECELCAWARPVICVPDAVEEVAWASNAESDDEIRNERWTLQPVLSMFVEAVHEEEPPLAEFADVRRPLAAFLLARGFVGPLTVPPLYARARARNKYGWGPFSDSAKVGKVRPPRIRAVQSTTTSVALAWDALDRRSAAYEVIIRLVQSDALQRRKRVLFAFNSLPLLNLRRRHGPPQVPAEDFEVETRRGQRAWKDDDEVWTRVSRDRTLTSIVATRLRPGRAYDVRVRSCPLLGEPAPWSSAAVGTVATEPVRPEAPPLPLCPKNTDEVLMVLAKGPGANHQRRNLTSMRRGSDRGRPSDDPLGRAAIERRGSPSKKKEKRSFDSDSDDDSYGEPHRQDPLCGDVGRRLGACSDEGGYLGWCSLVLPPTKDANGAPVDAWEVEVKSEVSCVRHSCALADDGTGAATVFLVPARTYDLRGRCSNRAGWSRWSPPRQIKTPCGLCPPTMCVVAKAARKLVVRITKPCVVDVGKLFRAGGRGGNPIVKGYEANEPEATFPPPAACVGAYEVGCRDVGDADATWHVTQKKSGRATFKTVVHVLTPGETYDLRARARYAAGWSAWSASLRVVAAQA